MALSTPQEIQVWYILPAIRRSLVQEMAKHKVRQNEIARQLGITQAAVSQYVSHKRGMDLPLPAQIRAEIHKSAKRIIASKGSLEAFHEIQRIAKLASDKTVLCDIHRRHDKHLPSGCDICFTSPGQNAGKTRVSPQGA